MYTYIYVHMYKCIYEYMNIKHTYIIPVTISSIAVLQPRKIADGILVDFTPEINRCASLDGERHRKRGRQVVALQPRHAGAVGRVAWARGEASVGDEGA